MCLLQVLYVPDQDELAKLAPPPPPPPPPPPSTEPPVTSSISSGDSEITPTIITVARGEGEADKGEGERTREVVETEGGTSLETVDTHISIVSKYISEDQVSLVVCLCHIH